MKLVSLDLTEAPATVDAWRKCWAAVGTFEKGRAWAYGDLFLQGREYLQVEPGRFYTWQEQAAQILKMIPHVGIETKTIINWAMVANKFPPKSRFNDLAWALHRELVDVSLNEALKWLKLARANDWAVEDLRQARAEKLQNTDCGLQNGETDSAPLGFVPRRVVQDTVRWFKVQFETDPLDDWSKDRRAALKREFQPLLDILHAL